MLTKEQVEKLNLAAPETIDYLVRTLGLESEYVHIWGSLGFLCEAALELYDKLEKAEAEIAKLKELYLDKDAWENALMKLVAAQRRYEKAEVEIAEMKESHALQIDAFIKCKKELAKLRRLVEGKDV